MSGREHFFYGALVGAGAVALGCGACLGTLGLWRLSQQVYSSNGTVLSTLHMCRINSYLPCNLLCNLPQRGHGHGHGESHGHCHGGFGDEEMDQMHVKMFQRAQYAPAGELAIYPFVPRDSLEFYRTCADLCIKHKQVCERLLGMHLETVHTFLPPTHLSPPPPPPLPSLCPASSPFSVLPHLSKEGVVSRVMEVGCAMGRTSFELTRGFESVVGVDISQTFVDKCNEIKRTGQTEYWLPREGELGETKTVHLSSDIVSVASCCRHTHSHTHYITSCVLQSIDTFDIASVASCCRHTHYMLWIVVSIDVP